MAWLRDVQLTGASSAFLMSPMVFLSNRRSSALASSTSPTLAPATRGNSNATIGLRPRLDSAAHTCMHVTQVHILFVNTSFRH
jgi:hypothetical protein